MHSIILSTEAAIWYSNAYSGNVAKEAVNNIRRGMKRYAALQRRAYLRSLVLIIDRTTFKINLNRELSLKNSNSYRPLAIDRHNPSLNRPVTSKSRT